LLKNNSIIKKNTEFVGPVCESSDTFISYNKYQKLNEGDYVCIDNIGAYGRSLASNYNTRPYSAEISDTFISYNKYQKLNEGDYVCIDNIGAYGRSLASNYNTRPYSAEILINKNKYKIIRQRQKLESLIN